MGHQKRIRDEKRRHKILVGILCLLTLGMWAASGTPEKKLPKQDDPDKVYLVNSDELTFDKEQSADYRVLRGNVVFRKDSMYMYCDSAYFYEKETHSMHLVMFAWSRAILCLFMEMCYIIVEMSR
mgnify:CR=1 FL=1